MSEMFKVTESEQAAGRIRELIRRIAVEVFGTTETEVPIPGFTNFTDRKPDDPLAGIRAALLMRSVAEGQLYDYARSARAAGRSWDEIGAVLGLATDGVPIGEAAFGRRNALPMESESRAIPIETAPRPTC
ncbi:hypothetical protein [Pseudonocardia alni]|uniref:Carboxymuconolactone decarboxylase family protein n=1 Tax=Pseudonocardia alni subsp. carboxydivorans TaxID=415010 RepID=A0ABU9ANK8_PSEA5